MALNLVDFEGGRVAAKNQPVEHSIFMGSPRKVGEDERVATFRNDNIRVLFSEEIDKIENLLQFATRVYCEILAVIFFDLERAYFIREGSDLLGFSGFDF